MSGASDLTGMFAARARGQCPFCRKEGPFEYKDALSRKEASLSGLCQPCQDAFFTEEPPEAACPSDEEREYVAQHGEEEPNDE